MKKRIFAVFLAVLFVALSVLPVFADGTGTEVDFAKTSVKEDLSGAVLNGKPFQFEDYPRNTKDTDVYLLTALEVGYDTTDMSNYGFYLYLYNPSGQALDVSSGKSRVQMETGWTENGVANAWNKFNLEFVSTCTDEGYEYVYYKFRVGAALGGGRMISDYLASNKRVYGVSGVELKKLIYTTYKDYNVGMRYEVTGSDKNKSKITMASKIDTLELKVNPTYFRSSSSSAGVNHYNQLNAVYFNVPAEYWDNYDYLYSIRCSWEEYRTTPMIVTDNMDVYDLLAQWRGIGDGYDSANKLSLYTDKKTNAVAFLPLYPDVKDYRDWVYNYEGISEGNFPPTVIREGLSKVYVKGGAKRLTWSFYAKEINLRKTSVTASEVLSYWETYKDKYKDDMLLKLSNDIYVNGVPIQGYRVTDILFDKTFEMKSYSSNHNWLQRLLNYNIFNGGFGTKLDDDYSGIQAIEEVSDKYETLGAEALASKYFVNAADAEIFKSTVDSAKKTGAKTIVFRFAVTDYFAEEVNAEIDGKKASGTTYRAEQTVFLDFDIISLTFKKDVDLITIPVVSNPTTIIGGIDAPQVDKDASLDYIPGYVGDLLSSMSGFFTILRRIMMILLGIAIAVGVFFLVTNFSRISLWIQMRKNNMNNNNGNKNNKTNNKKQERK